MDKQQLLKQLEKAWTAIKESYAGLSDAQLTEPGVMGNWSVKDILAHVTTWEEEALKYLPLIITRSSSTLYQINSCRFDNFFGQGLRLIDLPASAPPASRVGESGENCLQ